MRTFPHLAPLKVDSAPVSPGHTAAGTGLPISSSRAILYAGHGEGFAAAARAAASELRDTINRCRRG